MFFWFWISFLIRIRLPLWRALLTRVIGEWGVAYDQICITEVVCVFSIVGLFDLTGLVYKWGVLSVASLIGFHRI